MHVGVVFEVRTPGVQHRRHPAYAAQLLGEQLPQRLPRHPHQQAVQRSGVEAAEAVELVRQRKGDVTVGYRKQLTLNAFVPGPPLAALAEWTVAVAAGVVLIVDVAAVGARQPPTAQGRRAAHPDGPDQIDGAAVGAVGADVFLPVGAQQGPYSASVSGNGPSRTSSPSSG